MKFAGPAWKYLILTIGGICFVFPLYWMVTGSFKPPVAIWAIPPEWFPQQIRLDNYVHLFTTKPVYRWLFNSVFLCVVNVVFVLFFSAMAGYAFAKKKFPGAHWIFYVVISTMMMPREVILVPLYILIAKWGLVNTYAGLILPGLAYPFGIFLVRQFAKTIPDEILESARMDGAGESTVFFRFMVPLLTPALGALAIFSFMHTWNDYMWQLVVLNQEKMFTLPLGVSMLMYEDMTINYGYAMTGATIAALPMIVFFIVLQKSFINGIVMGSVKG